MILFFFFYFSVLVGAQSDPTISVDDPISDEFFFLAWNAAAKLNASIYDKVEIKAKKQVLDTSPLFPLHSWCHLSRNIYRLTHILHPGLQMSAPQHCAQLTRAEGVHCPGAPLWHKPRTGQRRAEGRTRAVGPLPPEVPVRGEPAASAEHQGRHGSCWAVDINTAQPTLDHRKHCRAASQADSPYSPCTSKQCTDVVNALAGIIG